MASYPWYEIVPDPSLEQGDFFFSCQIPTFLPGTTAAEEQENIPVDIQVHDVIVVTQSCDLQASKVENVLVCPVFPVTELETIEEYFRSTRGKEEIRRGNIPGLHMLAECKLNGFIAPVRIVNFRQAFSLPFHQVNNLAIATQPRLRLLPPYREHLSQAFARFIMRVGLPVDIPIFSK
jgi:hypothetical protein